MRKTIYITLLTLALGMLTACQNNGQIGWIFGVWRVASYSVDGEPQTDPLIGRTTLAFQGDVVEVVTLTDDLGSANENYGTWALGDNSLTLNFTHYDDNRPAGTDLYQAPHILGMTSDYPMEMAMTHSGDICHLTWTLPDGVVKKYELRKTW